MKNRKNRITKNNQQPLELYSLETSRDKQFKTTPPQFDTKVVRDKIHGTLWDKLS